MYEFRRDARSVHAVRLRDDTPTFSIGLLIPQAKRRASTTQNTVSIVSRVTFFEQPAFLLTFSVLLFALSLGSAGYSALVGSQSVASPIVVLDGEEPNVTREFNYGVHA